MTALSAWMLQAGRRALGDGQEVFAAKAGVSLDLVARIEDGSRPAWDVPGPELFPLVNTLDPGHGEAFWTAMSCDLLLTNLLSGDDVTAGVAAEEALSDPARRELARLLLRCAMRGSGDSDSPLLGTAERELLRKRAVEVAGSLTPCAWVGAEILAAFGGAR